MPAFPTRRALVSLQFPRLNRFRFCVVATTVMLAVSYLVVARSCAYDHVTLLLYAVYVSLHVVLPGAVILAAAQHRKPSALELLALGLPLGFAAEIAVFFAASAAHIKGVLPFSPLLWILIGALRFPHFGTVISRRAFRDLGLGTPGACCAVAALILAFAVTVVSQMYAGAPFVGGILAYPTHHDWIYLLSRTAEIKDRWPLQDPSMAGQPLSYHYFLLVHLASASLVTGIKLEMLGLRLFVLPLSAALIAQCLLLGRWLTRNVWGGILCGALVLIANELSFGRGMPGSEFGNEFVSWLFISPTFFFGMVYSGALILWVYRLLAAPRISVADGFVLALLAMVGTGAKGTVVPPLLVALSIWCVVETLTSRRFPVKTTTITACLAVGFASVYFTVLADWGTGAAAYVPLASIKLSYFWQSHVEAWERVFENQGLYPALGRLVAVATGICVILVGYSGVRLLGWLAVWRWKDQPNRTLTCWLGLMAFVYFCFGNFLTLDSNAQLYLLYPGRLPEAALSAAVILTLFLRARDRLRDQEQSVQLYCRGLGLLALAGMMCVLVFDGSISWWVGILVVNAAAFFAAPPKRQERRLKENGFRQFLWETAPVLAVAIIALVQVNDWRRHNAQGLRLWLNQPQKTTDNDVVLLRNAMDWIRTHTAPNAVFVANAFSDKNLRPGSLAQLDHTTVDKYYYYSALAERRLWVEGPTYLRAQDEAARRVEAASRVFYAGAPVSTLLSDKTSHPDYAIIDRTLKDGASVHLPRDRCIFENARISVYSLNPTESRSAPELASVMRRQDI